MKNFLWGTESFNDKPIRVVLFVSRNKDNKDIGNFKERRKSFIAHVDETDFFGMDMEKILKDFYAFAMNGVEGEISRCYISVNTRDANKIYKDLLHFLIDTPDFNLCSISSKLAGIAAKKENALTKKWMFDFDSTDESLLTEFCDDIIKADKDVLFDVEKTPHGFAIVTNRGFDTRDFIDKWKDIATLKRDDLLCIEWSTKRDGRLWNK